MSQRAAHRSETLCLGCLRELKVTQPRSSRRRGTSAFCLSCRVSSGEPRFVDAPGVAAAAADPVATLALIEALGFWLDA